MGPQDGRQGFITSDDVCCDVISFVDAEDIEHRFLFFNQGFQFMDRFHFFDGMGVLSPEITGTDEQYGQ